MNSDLPFVAEYAKSSRASCKICKTSINKETLRIGIMVQSPSFDGKIPLWHHSKCFLEKKKVKTIADIANFDNLRWEDQEKIKKKVAAGSSNGSASSDGDFSIEYAKSSRSVCKVCAEKIVKGELRISKLVTDSPEAIRYGPMPAWRHVDCFVKVKEDLGFVDSAANLPGFNSLSAEDKDMLKGKLKGIKGSESGSGMKRKNESDRVKNNKVQKISEEDLALKAQNELLYKMRDKLKANLTKKDMISLLQHNNQHISTGESNLLDHLTDCLLFGALKMCPECKNARPRFKIDGYHCSGNVTEWTKCQYVTKSPEREPFKVPEEFKEEFDFLNNYKYVKRNRIFPTVTEVASADKKNLPLDGQKIVIIGKLKKAKIAVQTDIEKLGGKVHSKVENSVMCCISTEAEVSKDSAKIQKARTFNVHVVSLDFVEHVKKGSTPAVSIKENTLAPWGEDPILKFGIKQEGGVKSSKSEVASSKSSSSFTKSVPQTMKITVTGSAAVDPDSGMECKCHVFEKRDNIYNAVLGKVDIARGTNTYYKLQILEDNKKPKYWVFRSWGRVGTTIGGTKLEKMDCLESAITSFEDLYLEKTGNLWCNRKNFVKQPGLLYPLDIDYGQECDKLQELKPGDNSKLPKPVQELICLIFDIEAMKKAMIEFEIDLQKMPLGKLSKKQIELAYSVLSEAQQILLSGSNATKILDASNRFYTLIPHDFGLKAPPLLDNEELIKTKIEMLDSLLEIEIAYNLLKGEDGESGLDPVDEHYNKLQTKIEVLDKDSFEYSKIDTYLTNTHAKTHDQYNLQLDQVFKINRQGEDERYKAFKDMHNKKLLWHGSRLTNYVGILSQGLRIAPPEAPVTGYMFGKGIYFADMVSKSANYCFTNKKNPTGILLLCEVALGNMYERTNAEYVEKLPKNKHSTKGLGQTVPDPKEVGFIDDVEVPYGKPVKSDVARSALLYNEYIVYDVNQVNIKYLLKVNFKWKR